MRNTRREVSIKSTTILIPAYNEEQAIGAVLKDLQATMVHAKSPYEIIVVDDGSDDATAEIARQFAKVTVLQHRENRGYGAALKTGIRHAQYELICITDADGTYPSKYIPELVTHLTENKWDMVVGARVGEEVSIPLIRKPAKWLLRQLAKFVAEEPIPDLNSGLRVFRREIALRLLNLLPDRFSFTTTITLAMLTNNYLVDYMPIDYLARVGHSKIKPVRDTLYFLQLVGRIALYFAPLKIFLPTSIVLFTIAVAWAVFSKVVLGKLADVSTLVIAMTAFQVAVIGMLAEIINRRLPNYYQR